MGIVEMAEEVGQQLPATKNLHECLSRAEELAARRKHTVVGIDHLLLALGQDPDALGEMIASQIDVKPLCADLLRKLGPEARVISPNAVPPGLDITVQNLLAHASSSARESGRTELDGGHIMKAVINGDGGFAAHRILAKHGLESGAATAALREAAPAPRSASDKPAAQLRAQIGEQPEEQARIQARIQAREQLRDPLTEQPTEKTPQQHEAPAAAARPPAQHAAPPEANPQQAEAAGRDNASARQPHDPAMRSASESASPQARPAAGREDTTPREDTIPPSVNDPVRDAIIQANQDLTKKEQSKRPDFGRRDNAAPMRGEAPPTRSMEPAPGTAALSEELRAQTPAPPPGGIYEEYPGQMVYTPQGQTRQDQAWPGQPQVVQPQDQPHSQPKGQQLGQQQGQRHEHRQGLMQGQPHQEPDPRQQSAQMREKAESTMPKDTSRDPATLASMAPERAAPPPPKKSERPLPPPNPQQPDRQMMDRQPAFLKKAGQPQMMPEWPQHPPHNPSAQPSEALTRQLHPAPGENPQRTPPPHRAEHQEAGQNFSQNFSQQNKPDNGTHNQQPYPPQGQPPVMRPPVAAHAGEEGDQLPDDPPPLRPRAPQQQPGQQPPFPQQGTTADEQAMQEIAANIRRNQASLEQHGIDDQVIENIPKVMRVDKLHYIEVRVARFTDAELEFDTEGYGLRSKSEKKQYTKAITVHLTGPDGQFLIDNAAAATQWCELHRASVDDADFAVWRWRVLPRKAGISKLRLDVTVRATGENGLSAEIPVQPSKSFEIKVTRNYGRLFKRAFTILLLFGLGFAIARYGPLAYQTAQQEITKMLKDDDGS